MNLVRSCLIFLEYNLHNENMNNILLDKNFDIPLNNMTCNTQPIQLGYLYFISSEEKYLTIIDLNNNNIIKKDLSYDDKTLEPLYVYANLNGDLCLVSTDMTTAKDKIKYVIDILKKEDILK